MESGNIILQENRVTISAISRCQEISSSKLSKNPTRKRSDCIDSQKFTRDKTHIKRVKLSIFDKYHFGSSKRKVYKPETLKIFVVNRLCQPYLHRKTVYCSSCLPFSVCLKRVFSLVIDEGVSVVV